jgi:hypothetical protein
VTRKPLCEVCLAVFNVLLAILMARWPIITFYREFIRSAFHVT